MATAHHHNQKQSAISALEMTQQSERPIDLVQLSRKTLGDRTLEIELLGLFARQAEQIIERIAITSQSAETVRCAELARTLMGSAHAVGAARVARASEAYCVAASHKGATEMEMAEMQAAVTEAKGAVTQLLAA